MRLLRTIIILTTLASSCNNERTKNTVEEESVTDKVTEAHIIPVHIEYPYNLHSIWVFDSMKDSIIQIHSVNRDTLSPELLVNLLNLDFTDKVHCEFVKKHDDTAFVRISDSEYLTQSMGTTGAYEYLISATFTVTELDEIEYVNFDFKEGDHANPGTYTRKHFIDEIENNKRLNK
jgi:hypothetical protein